jgi:hypothetical protein
VLSPPFVQRDHSTSGPCLEPTLSESNLRFTVPVICQDPSLRSEGPEKLACPFVLTINWERNAQLQ